MGSRPARPSVSFAPFTHTLRSRQDGWWNWRQLEEAGQPDVHIQLPGWENYYLPMTSYIESKAEKANNSLPGPLCFSERIAAHPIVGQQKPRYFENSSSAGL